MRLRPSKSSAPESLAIHGEEQARCCSPYFAPAVEAAK
jgi:hypothetical protein